MLKSTLLLIISFAFIQCHSQQESNISNESSEAKELRQEQIIQEHVYDCADKMNFNLAMKEYQACLDAGIKKDSTIAYLWQQKAMPYFKVKKYEVGMHYIDKAVALDAKSYQPYRAFIKCIFAKTYKEAIIDFEQCIANWGDSFEMDHTYSFYIGLSYLQLNEFEKAESYFNRAIEKQQKAFKEAHHVDLFYLGITKYELGEYEEAIRYFDAALVQYPEFSDAMHYKGLCFARLKRPQEQIIELIKGASELASKGYTINEANSVYEIYPYQVKH